MTGSRDKDSGSTPFFLPLGDPPRPLFRRPGILQHSTIPQQLWGVAPRIIEGQTWWDQQRTRAYQLNNQCCWACGVHRHQAEEHVGILDAHECYLFNPQEHLATFQEVAALCRPCHQFIHIGRLWYEMSMGILSYQAFTQCFARGRKILEDAHLPMSERHQRIYQEVCIGPNPSASWPLDEDHPLYQEGPSSPDSPRQPWRLLYKGNLYTRGPGRDGILCLGPYQPPAIPNPKETP